MRSPVVSVLLPVYEADLELLRLAITSILQQTFRDFELFILEDPSGRPAEPVLRELNDSRIKHFLGSQKGTLVEMLNRGLHHATGEFIARMDADDICAVDRFEKQVEYLRQHPRIDILGTQLAIIDQMGTCVGRRHYPLEHEGILSALRYYSALAHPSVMFRKDAVVRAGGYRAFYSEDYELWSRLAAGGSRFANLPEALLSYRVNPEGIRGTKVRKMLEGTLEVKRLYWRNQMSLGARLRMWGERCLCWMPPRMVLSLFIWLTFCRAGR